MTKSKAVKEPKSKIEVGVISHGPARTVVVEQDGDTIRVGDDTYNVTHDDIFYGRKMPKAVVVKGRARALPVWAEAPGRVTSRQLDTAAHNNLLEQLNNLAKSNTSKLGTIGLYIALAVVGLIVIGATVNVNGNIKDLRQEMALQAATQGHATVSDGVVTQYDSNGQPISQNCLYGTPGCNGPGGG